MAHGVKSTTRAWGTRLQRLEPARTCPQCFAQRCRRVATRSVVGGRSDCGQVARGAERMGHGAWRMALGQENMAQDELLTHEGFA